MNNIIDIKKVFMNYFYQNSHMEIFDGGECSSVCKFTIPVLDTSYDYIQIYVYYDRNRDKYVATDDGYYLSILKASGYKCKSEDCELLLNNFLDVHLKDINIISECGAKNEIGHMICQLIQAITVVINCIPVLEKNKYLRRII